MRLEFSLDRAIARDPDIEAIDLGRRIEQRVEALLFMQPRQRQGDRCVFRCVERFPACRICPGKIGISVHDGRPVVADTLFANMAQQVDREADMPFAMGKARQLVIAAIPAN